MSTSETITLPPDMVASTQGDIVLSEFLQSNQGLILYFYPRDNTPGCTTQALDFTQQLNHLQSLGYQVIGVSRDSLDSHTKFIEKKSLGIPLISDPDEMLCRHFDVIREKNSYGKKVMGLQRSTFIFASTGQLQHALRNVRAKGHVDRVIKLLEDTASSPVSSSH